MASKDQAKNKKELSPKEQYNANQRLIDSAIRKVIQDVAISKSGKLFFFWLMKTCGFQTTSIAYGDNKEIDKDGLLINEALRRMYLNVRQHIPAHILPQIEYLDITKYIVEELKIEKGEKK